MNQKTDTMQEFSPNFKRWLVILTLGTLLLSIYISMGISTYNRWGIPAPWVLAGGVTISEGINLFSNGTVPVIGQSERYHILCSLLVFTILGPTLLLFSWRKIKIIKQRETAEKKSSTLPTVLMIIGGMLTMVITVLAIATVKIQYDVSRELKRLDAVQENSEQLKDNLCKVSSNAYEYWILPLEFNGGNKSYREYKIPESMKKNEYGKLEILEQNENRITFKSISLKYPSSFIFTELDTSGILRNFKYEGLFD